MSRLFKKFSAISLILTVLAPLGGCIKDELPGIEVDILDVSADTDGLLNVFYNHSQKILRHQRGPQLDQGIHRQGEIQLAPHRI